MAVIRQTVALSATTATPVTFTRAFSRVRVVIEAITSGSSVVVWGRTDGVAASSGADEEDAVIGGLGAYTDFDAGSSSCTAISLYASGACSVIVEVIEG